MNMKKISTYLTLLAMMAIPMTFISCDEHDSYYYWDEPEPPYAPHEDYSRLSMDDMVLMAQYLNAHWRGMLTATYQMDNGQWVKDAFDIDWEFDQDAPNATYGRGQEVSYVGGEQHGIRNFSWRIEPSADIRVVFDDGVEMLILYDEMDLTVSMFSGTMQGMNIEETDEFTLSKVMFAQYGPDKGATTKAFGGKHQQK